MAAKRKKRATAKKAVTTSASPEVIYEAQPPSETSAVYTNNAQITISSVDVQFRFNRVLNASENEIHVVNQATVIMSPKYALAFADLLIRNVETIMRSSTESEFKEEQE